MHSTRCDDQQKTLIKISRSSETAPYPFRVFDSEKTGIYREWRRHRIVGSSTSCPSLTLGNGLTSIWTNM